MEDQLLELQTYLKIHKAAFERVQDKCFAAALTGTQITWIVLWRTVIVKKELELTKTRKFLAYKKFCISRDICQREGQGHLICYFQNVNWEKLQSRLS